ncbi:MAG: hypothetical protein JKX98_00465 [Alcanivoracaceae bacterium]|nr:hypothetical protein [Alcanivoracaceae bacterium]
MNLSFIFPMLIFVFIAMPVLLLILRQLALKIGLVDVPNSRKIHLKAVPIAGGVALYLMAVALLWVTNNVSSFSFHLVAAAGLVVLVGLLDDMFQLTALWRFIVQIMASLLVIYFTNEQLSTFGFLLYPDWDIQLGMLAIPVTVFGVVGIINALNMADGIDGLAAMTFVSPVFVMALLAEQNALRLWLLLLLVCVLIFVLFNKSTVYKVFLGDNGSLFLGFILAWLLVYFSQGDQTHIATIKPVTALYLVALPLYDTIFVMLKRIVNGVSPFKPDNSHLHHLFMAIGFTQTKTLFAMIFSQIIMIGVGIILLYSDIKEHYQFYLFVFMSIIYFCIMHKMWKNIKNSE